MVTTRRGAAASPEPLHATAAREQEAARAPVVKKNKGRKTTARAPSAAKTAAPAVSTIEATVVATSNKEASGAMPAVAGMRRTRSKQTASPLKVLDFDRAPVAKTPVTTATPLKTKRKHGASHYSQASGSATPGPETQTRESTQDEGNEDQGMFFTQSTKHKSVSPTVSPVNKPDSPISNTVSPITKSISPVSKPVSPLNKPVSPCNTLVSPLNKSTSPVSNFISPINNSIPQLNDSISISQFNDSFAFLDDPAYMYEAFTCRQDDTVMSEDTPVPCQDRPAPRQDGPASQHEEPCSPYRSPPHSTYASYVPSWIKMSAAIEERKEARFPLYTGHVSSDTPLEAQFRERIYLLECQLDSVDQRNYRLLGDNMNLKSEVARLQIELNDAKKYLPPSPRPQAYRVQANKKKPDMQTFGMADTKTNGDEFLEGSASAIELLHRIENAAREPRTVYPDTDDEGDKDMHPTQQDQQKVTESESASRAADTTPARLISTPSSFFSRSISAIKSRLGFSTSTPPQPSPTPKCAPQVPPPDTFTEVLSAPPTPVGERRKTRPRKNKQNFMLKLLTKGVEPSDMPKAEAWAKQMIPTLMNYNDFAVKRKRLQTPVLFQDLEHFPSSKPWQSGYGDPLGDLDDEDVVPVWAVVLEILAEEELPKRKKMKASHEVSMDIDDTLSLNDIDRASQQVHDSHGHSASHMDIHPRRSIEPSPIFSSTSPHQPGSNVFGELHGLDTTTQDQANQRETLPKVTKEFVPKHNPSKGSFGLDYDSDEDDSSILEDENSDAGEGAAPLWTQPPPPAPVPAHAPLPGGSSVGTPSASAESVSATAEQPVDEVERQRQKLMKHTPAKPSRLREAFVPSPSVLSDAGNQSLFLDTPLAPANSFDDMPGAEELDLTPEDWAAIEAITSTAEWKAADAANAWPDPTYMYGSSEEELSPV